MQLQFGLVGTNELTERLLIAGLYLPIRSSVTAPSFHRLLHALSPPSQY